MVRCAKVLMLKVMNALAHLNSSQHSRLDLRTCCTGPQLHLEELEGKVPLMPSRCSTPKKMSAVNCSARTRKGKGKVNRCFQTNHWRLTVSAFLSLFPLPVFDLLSGDGGTGSYLQLTSAARHVTACQSSPAKLFCPSLRGVATCPSRFSELQLQDYNQQD